MALSKFALLGEAERAARLSLVERVALLPPRERRRLLVWFRDRLEEFALNWVFWARPWAREVVRAAETWEADLVVAETNQGGEMVTSVLRSVDSALPVRAVKARYGKSKRAEPVSALFARGKAKFAGAFPELEDELCGMTSGGYEGPGRSPDRADAMVWAMAELLLGERAEPRIRRL